MKYLFLFLMTLFGATVNAQRVESIHFHLYTDSLKKGTHNYINVDGKLENGNWMPLTEKEITFSADYGKFEGNDLVLPNNTTVTKVVVSATLKSNKNTTQQITIWIKQNPDPPLSTQTERNYKPVATQQRKN